MDATLSQTAKRRLTGTVRLALASAVAATAWLGIAPAQTADTLGSPVGKLVSVNGGVRVGRGGKEADRPIERDGLVYPGDILRADKKAGYQLRLADRSLLNGGADSVMAVDRHAFDPRTNAGGLIVTFQRGIFRFVGPPYASVSQQPIVRCALLTRSGEQERLATFDVPIQVPPNSQPIQLQCQRRVLETAQMAELLRSIGETPDALANQFEPLASSGGPPPQTTRAEGLQPDAPSVRAPEASLFPDLSATPDEPPAKSEAEDPEREKLGRSIFELSHTTSDEPSAPLDGAPDDAASEEPKMAAGDVGEDAETTKADTAQADRAAKQDAPSPVVEADEPDGQAGEAVDSDGAAAAAGLSDGNAAASESLRATQVSLKNTRDILRRLRDRRISGAVTPMPETAVAGPIELAQAPKRGSASIREIIAESPPPAPDEKALDAASAPPASARDRLAEATRELAKIEALIADLPGDGGGPSLRARIARARDNLANLRGEILNLRDTAVKADDATIERLASGTPMTEGQYDARLRRADEILSGPKFATLKQALEYIAFGDNPRPSHGTLAPHEAPPPAPPFSPGAAFSPGAEGSLEELDEQDETGMAHLDRARYAVQIGAYSGLTAAREAASGYRAREGREATAVKF